MWYLRDDSNAAVLQAAWNRTDGAPRSLRAFDPLLDDTLSLARASGLVEQMGTGRQKLSPVGGRLADNLRSGEVMEIEQSRLTALGGISEARMWERLGRPGDDLSRRSSLG
jgi:hypothetical protein